MCTAAIRCPTACTSWSASATARSSGSSDRTVKLFNVNDGAVLRTFKHHTRAVNSLALLPDGLRFVSGSDYHTACIVEHGLAPFVA